MKPNVVLINCDDLGYGDIETYGSDINKTPYLNKLVQSGMRFTDAYAASSICSPSRAALMTACLPPRIGLNRVLFPGEPYGLNPEEYTMPQMFSDNGYKSIIIGKWHCGDQQEFLPCNFGFDDYYGIPYSNDMGVQITPQGDKTPYPPLPLIRGNDIIQEQPDQNAITERYTEEAVKFIRQNKENPFFLYLAHMHVHLPLYAAERFVKQSQNGDFGACVEEMDWSCGVIMNELKRLNLEENTIIIFTSDNGSRAAEGASNKPLKGKKFHSWEGGFRVPFVMSWKGKIEAGTVNNNIVSHIDLMPTLCSIIGGEFNSDKKIDGVDISKTIFENETTRDEFAYFVKANNPVLDDKGFKDCTDVNLDAVRKGDWKLFKTRKTDDFKTVFSVNELYNLKEDISETNNIYNQHPEIVAELEEVYKRYETELGNYPNNIVGTEVRKCAKVDNPKTLTQYDPEHPYIIAMYDKLERG